MRPVLALALLSIGLAGCARDDGHVTVYLEQRLGPDGPPGQIAPVLEPARRTPRDGMGAAAQALVQLRQGPTPAERARGMSAPVSPGTRLRLSGIDRGTARVEVAGEPLDFMGVASVVFSLTELEDVQRARVCCLYRHDGTPITTHTRASFRGWRGEPCADRREHRCLRDR